VRFVAIGDTGKGNAGQNRVGASVGTHCATFGCDFVVLLGDNFYPSGVGSTTDPQWQTAFVDPYATVNAPFYAVLGNHDYGGDGAGTDLPRGDNEVAYSLVNPKWRMPSHHYKFTVEHVEFFVADTNRSMFSLDQNARADFDTWLPASTAPWKIVFAHHPYKSNGEHGNAGNYDGLGFVPIVNGQGVKRFVEERVCGRANFYITGHDHDIEWMQATCSHSGSTLQTNLIVSGGGAATTPIVGSQPTHYSSDQLGYVYVVIHDDTFTATFYDANGVEQYTRTVTR
jgi:predicted phosphodiesterase